MKRTLDPATAGLVQLELERLSLARVQLSPAALPVFIGGLRRKYPGLHPETHARLVRASRNRARVLRYCGLIQKSAA